jgi:predicted nucleotidyltransferase
MHAAAGAAGSDSDDTMLTVDDKMLTTAAQELGLRLVVLFGSHARQRPKPGPESDIDIAVYGCPRERYWDCLEALSKAFDGGELDLVRLEDADPLFRQEIMERGIRLHGDPDLFYEMRAYAYRDFVDSADLRALEKTLFEKKMARLDQALHDSP